MNSGIYTITNTKNGQRYVGSAANLKRRWRDHRKMLIGDRHFNVHLQRAWNKYGEQSFVFGPLFYCARPTLVELEQLAIDALVPEYNIAPVAGSQLGYKHTAEARKKMSAVGKGRKLTAEHKAKLSAAKQRLTPDHVHDIRHLIALGDMSRKEIAGHFPVSGSTVGRISRGEAYT